MADGSPIVSGPFEVATKLGATHAINVATHATALDPWRAGKGVFDTLFEASGNQAALRTALDVLRPGATLVQLGLGGEMTLPINSIVAKELHPEAMMPERFDTLSRPGHNSRGRLRIEDHRAVLMITAPYTRCMYRVSRPKKAGASSLDRLAAKR